MIILFISISKFFIEGKWLLMAVLSHLSEFDQLGAFRPLGDVTPAWLIIHVQVKPQKLQATSAQMKSITWHH